MVDDTDDQLKDEPAVEFKPNSGGQHLCSGNPGLSPFQDAGICTSFINLGEMQTGRGWVSVLVLKCTYLIPGKQGGMREGEADPEA